jgi:hypothetical protein
MDEHFVEMCRYCGAVMAQCRCMEPNKQVRWSACEKCRREREDRGKTNEQRQR